MLPTNASPIEVGWSSFSFLAFLVNVVILVEAGIDLKIAYALPINNKRRIVATSAMAVQAGLTAMQLTALLIGVLAMVAPSARPDGSYSPIGLALIGGTIFNEITAASLGIVARALRYRLDRTIAAEDDATATSMALRFHQETMEALKENTEATKDAAASAGRAFHEANAVNEKIRAVGERALANTGILKDHIADSTARRDEREALVDAREDARDERDDQTRAELEHNTDLTEAAKDAAETLLRGAPRSEEHEPEGHGGPSEALLEASVGRASAEGELRGAARERALGAQELEGRADATAKVLGEAQRAAPINVNVVPGAPTDVRVVQGSDEAVPVYLTEAQAEQIADAAREQAGDGPPKPAKGV